MDKGTKLKLYILISSVFCLCLFSFLMLAKKTEAPIEDLAVIYRQDSLGFSMRIPARWRGKYEVLESVSENSGRKISFIYNVLPENKAELFSVFVYKEADWMAVKENKHEEIEISNSNGLTYTWKIGVKQPYSRPQLDDFLDMQKQVGGIISSFSLTGRYLSRTVDVYFPKEGDADCGHVLPVGRVLDFAPDYEMLALRELFSGTREADAIDGYHSFFSSTTKNILQRFVIRDQVAYVDLVDIRQGLSGISSSCGSQQFLAQVQSTLGQFGLKKVIISINGRADDFYEWIQVGCKDDICRNSPFSEIKK